MNICDLIEKVKRSVDYSRVGMIVCHNGVVRATTRDGRPAEKLSIKKNGQVWERVLKEMRSRPGIAAVEAYLHEGERKVGEDVLLVVVAGDIRENVFPVLEETVNRLKSEAIIKEETVIVAP